MKQAHRCGWCGAMPALGDASINDTYYCHEEESPTCYELATRRETKRMGRELDLTGDSEQWAKVRNVLGEHVDNPTVQRWVREFRLFMRTRDVSGVDRFFWEKLGVDEGGLPVHLPMPLTVHGQGPADPDGAAYLGCWCSDPECLLAKAFREAHELGRKGW